MSHIHVMVDLKRKSAPNSTNSHPKPKKMTAEHEHNHNHSNANVKKLPVTLLGGFLGTGKTTLLKHILENKHIHQEDPSKPFKCAVIVNDVAELNIDKALIDQSSLVQTEEVVAMQNGCVCCTLKSDLVDQIMDMAKSQVFDYMIIEASGISEPSEIAKLFAECDEDHNHEEAHGDNTENLTLYDVATLDTCVTVVDAGDFFDKLQSIQKCTSSGGTTATYAKLMVEQVEYSNVVLINKADLVSQEQIDQVTEHVTLLNPKANILVSKHSVVDVKKVVGTNLYNVKDFENIVSIDVEVGQVKSCCKASIAKGESACCKRARTIDSGLSQVMLSSKSLAKTRHEVRFGISSFVYKARRPFHSSRFHVDFVNKYFMFIEPEEEDCEHEEGEEEGAGDEQTEGGEQPNEQEGTEEEKDAEIQGEEEEEEELSPEEALKKQQQEAEAKGQVRDKDFGSVLRGKGFIWTAHTHDFMIAYGQAGNTVEFALENEWKVLNAKAWNGKDEEKAEIRKNFVDPWGDRRQELVFIGKDMNHEVIQKVLDGCLLNDDEMNMGVDGWKATIGNAYLNDE